MEDLLNWTSDFTGNKRSKVIGTYLAIPGTIQAIDSDIVKTIKQPLLNSSNGRWSQGGMRYLYDRDDNIYGVVFSSNSSKDIHDIWENQAWQHGTISDKLKTGDIVYVVPNETIINENPNAIGVKFKLSLT